MVCWDGSRPAARAIGDAMPLLERAGNIEIAIIDNERGKQEEIKGVDMGRHLARHGLKVEVSRILRADNDVADTLLSHSADFGADFVVMGGYGHSRLREFVLGGVTRRVPAFHDGADADVALIGQGWLISCDDCQAGRQQRMFNVIERVQPRMSGDPTMMG